MNERVMIAMSGGVDSSVAALLLKNQGYDCTGVTMKLFNNEDIGISCDRACCSLEDTEDARSVAYRLGMPHYVFNFSVNFKDEVIDRFIEAYEAGLTPNPCIDCNRYIKFQKLYLRAKELGYRYIATGHYANIEKDAPSGRYLLKKAADDTKDQSYVLYSLTQEQLAHTIFPLGNLTKSRVRELALENGFINAKKRESQDICFVRGKSYAEFIEEHTGKSYPPGDFIDVNGKFLGRHKGIIHYTIGQRKGLGVSSATPLYVCKISAKDNTVTLGSEADLYSRRLTAKNINLIAVDSIERPMRVRVKTRYRQPEQWAVAVQLDEDTLYVEFDEPQRAITGGQAAVLYDGDVVVGGGIISP